MIKSKLFLSNRFFVGSVALAFLFFLSFFFEELLPFAIGFFFIVLVEMLIEIVLLWSYKDPISAERIVPERMSNNDVNPIKIKLTNLTPFKFRLNIQEELPHQLNLRNFILFQLLEGKEKLIATYKIEPKQRGLYEFGNLNIFLRLALGLVERKRVFEENQETKVYPTYKNLNQYDIATLKTTNQYGVRKTRKIGHSMEFEQIKDYVYGDDIRHLNWKATAKRNHFMINQFNDEKSKEVYCLIDTGRNMRFPFHGLALVDYAINSSLVILKNALNSQDKAGMMSFNKKAQNFVKAEKRPSHIQTILEKLYNIKPQFLESDFSNLYVYLKRLVSHRSLLFLFTNFENYDSFERQLPYLQAINRSHVLVVIFFKNVEIEQKLRNSEVEDIVQQSIMEKQINEKKRIVSELQQRRIQTILTYPQNLTIDLLNKYIEIKAKALI